ncbi:hypothetical protein ES703_01182 [subsurface metagenome]
MAGQSIGRSLNSIHHTCVDKINEVLKLYIYADEFFKEATYELGDKFLQESNRMEQILSEWRNFYATAGPLNLPFDPEIHLSDIKTLCESSLRKTGEIIMSLDHSRRDLLCKLSLVYVVGLFEAFFTDSVEQLVSESQLKKFKNLSFKNQVGYLQNKLGIDVDQSQVRTSEIDEFFARRNLLLHCGGVVDKHYIDRVGYSDYKEGEEIPVDEHYFCRAAYSFIALAGYLYGVFKAKMEGNHGTHS